jgi:hypothetical protein
MSLEPEAAAPETIDPKAAALSLTDVERVERRTREALWYAGSSTFLIMWGVIAFVGHVIQHIDPRDAIVSWAIATAIGIAGGFAIAWQRRRTAQTPRPQTWRLLYAQIVLIAYGFLWTCLFGSHTPRQLDAFWPTLWMFGFVIAGFWVGRFYTIVGVVVTAFIAAGYLWIDPGFDLWVGFWTSGALIAGGLWLRRASLAR